MKKLPVKGGEGQALNINDFLCFAIYSANHAFNRVYHPLLQELDLTYPQFIAMISLWDEDGQTVGELGRKLYLQSNTLTPMLKRLEGLGYVSRKRSGKDERQVNITLTPAGRKLQAKTLDIIRTVRRKTGLTDTEMEKILASVRALRGSLDGLSS